MNPALHLQIALPKVLRKSVSNEPPAPTPAVRQDTPQCHILMNKAIFTFTAQPGVHKTKICIYFTGQSNLIMVKIHPDI